MPNPNYKAEVFSVSYTVFWDRFNLYGLQSIIVLYSIAAFGLVDKTSYSLYASYIALSYTFTVVGGILADRLLGYFYASIVGGLLIISANLIFCLGSITAFKIGLGCMVVGIGLLKPNNTNLLGMIHRQDSLARNKAFSIFYIATNLGSFIGPLLYGLSFTHNIANYVFIASAAGTISALLNLHQVKHFSLPVKQWLLLPKATALILTCLLISWLFIFHYELFGYFIILGMSAGVFWSIKAIKKLSANDRIAILSLFAPTLSGLFFMMAFFQVYSSLTLFVDRCVDRHIFGWVFPASWFGLLEPLCLFLMVPILNIVWKKLDQKGLQVSAQNKVTFGTFAGCLAFLVFALATQLTPFGNTLLVPLLLLANILLAIAELTTIPIAMSLISLVAPLKYRSTVMGIFYFSFTLSGYLSGVLSKIQPTSNISAGNDYTALFLCIALILFAATLLIFILNHIMLQIELKRSFVQI